VIEPMVLAWQPGRMAGGSGRDHNVHPGPLPAGELIVEDEEFEGLFAEYDGFGLDRGVVRVGVRVGRSGFLRVAESGGRGWDPAAAIIACRMAH
jgi:hypothetical protein